MDALIDIPSDWEMRWQEAGMPEYDQNDLKPHSSVVIKFANIYDREDFIRLVRQLEVTPKTKYIWFPEQFKRRWTKRGGGTVETDSNKYPVYIISKGRWESNVTARNLEKIGVRYKLVVEPQEFSSYYEAVKPWMRSGELVKLPKENYGGGCSIPARNWVWETSRREGHHRHWILDDNISGFFCLNHNMKPKVTDWNPFLPVEQFTDHYPNIGISGMNYEFFTQRRAAMAPYYLNTRVYSCLLIRNDLPFRWRGRYNEDTDLCIRVLKAGFPTVLFNYVQAKKVTTMTMKGGNTESLYNLEKEDGRLKMAESLKAQHPEIVTITRKWGRWQHHVDYKPFRKLKLLHPD